MYTYSSPVVVFKHVRDVEVVNELQRFGKVHEHGLTLVFAHGLEPHRVVAGSVHQGINTLTEYLTELWRVRGGGGEGGRGREETEGERRGRREGREREGRERGERGDTEGESG